ncbi:acyl-CoA dehydrogenase family protein [Sphingomonas sp. SRS2]|uniref:acyl-CoA dehydrogenase family protein n=1 Tax=Sphingomonas sp. SRS2 TaxID=133190 RepID=UPI0006970B90|nr:acyl-CoA dehydrogenase family protein [Sphingomonas sp. SRS2]
MDLALSEFQISLLDSVGTLLQRRRRPLTEAAHDAPAYARDLEDRLLEGGFLDVATEGGSFLDAALLTELAARELDVAPIAWRTILWPMLGITEWPIAPVSVDFPGFVRFGNEASCFLVIDARRNSVSIVDRRLCDIRDAGAGWGYPGAYVAIGTGGRPLSATAEDCLSRWRLALAAEIVGTASAAFDQTLAYIKDRKQFHSPIGAHQAVQHRAARLAVQIESARYLTYEAAWHTADRQLAAAAVTMAAKAALAIFREAHQMHGAIGYTKEYPLHRWTMRLRLLAAELGGVNGHARAVARTRTKESTE